MIGPFFEKRSIWEKRAQLLAEVSAAEQHIDDLVLQLANAMRIKIAEHNFAQGNMPVDGGEIMKHAFGYTMSFRFRVPGLSIL